MNPSIQPSGSALGRECWLPTLQLAIQEVFELMLACPLEVPPEPPAEDGLDITAMVGLAGQLCGILTVRCSTKSAARMASRMLGRHRKGWPGNVGRGGRDLQHGRGQLQE